MLNGIEWLEHLQKPGMLHAPYAFDRVEVTGTTTGGEPISMSILGVCYSEFASGPNLWVLANATAAQVGGGMYGLRSCRPLGYRSGGV